jgi:hypothetical protein
MELAKVPAHVFWLADVNHETVVEPTVVVIAIGLALATPSPVMVRDEPTVPDVAAVCTPLDIVDRATVALAA